MEILLELLFWPFMAFFQSGVALLMPSADPEVRRLQRALLIVFVLAISALLTAVGLAYFSQTRPAWIAGVVGYVVLLISGAIGSRIERLTRAENEPSEPNR